MSHPGFKETKLAAHMPLKARITKVWVNWIDRIANGRRRPAHADLSGPTLRGKVMLLVLSTTCLALLMSAAALLIYELRAYRESRLSDLQTQADIIAKATAPALSIKDTATATENLAMLRLRPQIRAAAIYQNNGQLFASYTDPAHGDVAPPARAHQPGHEVSGDKLELYHPVVNNQELLGTLYLRADNDIAGRLMDYLLILAGVMVASLAAAALITSRLQRAVTEPILQVAQVARDVMTQRDFSLRAPKTSSDEVGQLVDAFNDMLAEVAARTQALEETNHHLQVEMAERRKAEEALKDAARKKDEFLATLAHELRNPLAPISNAAEILRRVADQPDSPLRQRSLDIMARQLKQMVRLIDDLLDVSRITTGKLLLHKERIDLVRVLHNALEIAAPMLESRRHEVDVRLPDQPVYMDADATRLGQVFANLLNNAAKYTPEGGQIGLLMRTTGTQAEIVVCDNGIGISPEMHSAVFEMFVQVDQAIDKGKAGLGVGLTLAKQLTHLHGGEISVRSGGENRGSEFIVRLPILAPVNTASSSGEAASSSATDARAPTAKGPSLRVLVADDNVDFATSLASILEQLGHQVSLTHDGKSVLEVAPRLRPDVIFLDIGMPGLNGYEVAHRLRQQPETSHTVLVAVTGWSQEKDRQRSRASGITHHLAKPVDIKQLMPILAACQIAVSEPSLSH